MAFEVVVLGASGTFPTPEGACTGFLLRHAGAEVWLDAGTGTFANLQRHTDFFALTAVVLSHLHLDHFLDLYPLYYGLRYSHRSPGPTGLEVYAPGGAEEHLAQILSPRPGASFDGYFAFRTISSGTTRPIGPFDFSFHRAVHPVETLAMRIEAGGRSLFYTSDTGPGDELIALAHGADVLIAEASLHDPDQLVEGVHMTAEEAGELARRAQVGRLVLTHISPGLDPEVSVAHARRHFAGEVLAAREHLLIEV